MTRRVFFSFQYMTDVWRAWNVRNSWLIRPNEQESVGFFDSSVFEASRRQSEDSLKKFLREGLKNSSVTCVLAGSGTWNRRWVRYEIARSILKGNGLLTIYINGIKDKSGLTSQRGANPLSYVGLYRTDSGVRIAEKKGEKWEKYVDCTELVPERNIWFRAPTSNSVIPLSTVCSAHDFVSDDGRRMIGSWIENSAVAAGR